MLLSSSCRDSFMRCTHLCAAFVPALHSFMHLHSVSLLMYQPRSLESPWLLLLDMYQVSVSLRTPGQSAPLHYVEMSEGSTLRRCEQMRIRHPDGPDGRSLVRFSIAWIHIVISLFSVKEWYDWWLLKCRMYIHLTLSRNWLEDMNRLQNMNRLQDVNRNKPKSLSGDGKRID